ncbi:MAG TPA: NUDIX domain-containing protein [Gaiellaceae bacterium]
MIARFCSACGAPLREPPPTRCDACGVEHWRNPKPCANALVVSDGRVLLARRARAPWRGGWAAPGGFCEAVEHPADAAEREVLEETGVRARVTRLLGIWLDAYADDPGDAEASTITVAYYLAELADGEAPGEPDPAETAELGWFPLEALPAPLVPPGTLESVLEAARQALAQSERW